jgi:DNA-binding MarR family transcriptional regulator
MTVSNRQRAVKERSEAGEELSRLAVRVFQLEGLLSSTGDRLAQPAGQTSARWRILAAIEEAPRPVAEIARAWSLTRQSVQRIADNLAHDGLVAYAPNPKHRRAQLVQLTPRGRSVLNRIQTSQREWANTVGERIGAAELKRANHALARILETLPRDD